MKRTLFLAALGASLLGAGSAHAQALTAPAAYCDPTGFVGCIGMRTSMVSMGSTTVLSLWIQSLSGNIRSLGIFEPHHDYTVFVDVSTVGPVGLDANGGESYSRDDCSAFCTDVFLDYSGEGIIGCNVPLFVGQPYAYRTCAAEGLTGWARYDFTIYPTAYQPTPTYDFLGFDIGDCYFTGTTHITNCRPIAYPTVPGSVSPEPATLALLVPALLGIAAVRRRRKA